MPAPQLHLTFADRVQHYTSLPAALRRSCAAEPIYTRLGAIFHDLPYYYAPMVFEAVRYGLGVAALNEPWGYRMHSVRPAQFVASFLRSAATAHGLTPEEQLALCGGLLSHCALDLSLHPLVNYCARRDMQTHGGPESTHHRTAEKYHALFFHLERYGADPIGTPAFAALTRVTKHGSFLSTRIEPALRRFVTDVYQGAYRRAPSPLAWGRWVRNFRQFGLLLSMPVAAQDSLRTRTSEMRHRYYQNEVFDFRDFFAAAERRLTRLCWLGYEYLMAGDFSSKAESAFCASAGIDDLAEPGPSDPHTDLRMRCAARPLPACRAG